MSRIGPLRLMPLESRGPGGRTARQELLQWVPLPRGGNFPLF